MKAGSGRPLRAFVGALLVTLAWFALRVPGLEGRYDTAMLAVRPPTMAAVVAAAAAAWRGAPPPRLLPDTPASAPAPEFVTPAKAAAHRRNAGVMTPRLREAEPVVAGPAAPAVPATPVAVAAPLPNAGFDLATQAYARLAEGDRRAAERLFGAAIAASGDAPQVAAWARERRRLNRRWSGEAYSLFRDAGAAGAAASPVLGGGQSGASAAWVIDPLARRPLAVIARVYGAHDGRNRLDGDSAQAAIGVRWQPRAGVSVAVERLVAVGAATAGDWNLRVAAGGERRWGRVLVDGYGEAGARGNGDVYAGGQVRAAVGIGALGGAAFRAGPGAWGSIQTGSSTVSRVDLGVGVTGQLRAGVAVSADWRWRVAGNAAPVSGPALTVSLGF